MKKKIMVVDDEENILELVKAILEQEDFDIIGVRSGQECLDKLKEVKPNLILMDMMMPSMSGRETTEKIRKNTKTKSLKIAFLTVARFSDVGKDMLKDLGVLDYITKPFDNNDLVKRVKKLVG
jgi:DNA-binding response OmpR family regulator